MSQRSKHVENHHDSHPVVVTIEKLLPYGVFVRLENGVQGYIRRREMSWAGDVDPRELVQPHEQIKAIILDNTGHNGKVELSHKLILPNPWHEFTTNYREGDVVEGHIKDILPHGVYIKILSGVDGFIPLTQLAAWHIQNPEDLFWIDDQIEAVITKINIARRTVRLSIRRYMEQQMAVHSIMEQLGSNEIVESDDETFPSRAQEEDRAAEVLNRQVDKETAARVGSILIVEDEDNLRNSFVRWLHDRGYQVSSACDTATAIEAIENDRFNVYFVDLDLLDIDGLTFIQHLRRQKHNSHVIIMSSSEWMAERALEIEQAGVLAVLFKPLDLAEINNLLNRIALGDIVNYQEQHDLTPNAQSIYDSFQDLSDTMKNGVSFEHRLQIGVDHALKLTEAETGILFYLNPDSQLISIAAQVGQTVLNKNALSSLTESPVKDVLRRGYPVLETNVLKTAPRRFSKLLDLLPFESCIGVPLGDGIHSDYALFLFHRKYRAFHHYRLRDAQSVAALLTVMLERQALEQRVQAISAILLSGQLAAGFGHEVNNKISAVEIQLRNLQLMCTDLDKGSSRAMQKQVLTQAQNAQNGMLETVIDLKKTVRLFQSLSKGEQMSGVDTNQVIYQTRGLLQPILSKENTRVAFDLASDLPLVSGSAMRLQQVFLNIMLNAVQHMTMLENQEHRLHITTTIASMDDKRPLKVHITDAGTGIHRQLWKKIFDLGFSTRADGTGLGLFIARSLVESMGGRIDIEQSLIPIGTTFVVELPIIKEGK